MLVIAVVKGIKIYMNFQIGEHNPPHIHGVYDEKRCSVYFDGNVLEKGKMNNKMVATVVDFVKENKEILKEMWNTQNIKRIK